MTLPAYIFLLSSLPSRSGGLGWRGMNALRDGSGAEQEETSVTGVMSMIAAGEHSDLVEHWCQRDASLKDCLGAIDQVAVLGGLSNIVLDVQSSKGRFVLRLPRPGAPQLVDRQAELFNILAAAQAGLAVAPLHSDPENGLLLFPFLHSSGEAPEPRKLGWLLRQLHDAQGLFENKRELGDWLDNVIGRARLASSSHDEISRAEGIYRALRNLTCWQNSPVAPSHWDVTEANCLDTETGLVLIDWEFSALGPRAWDLAYAMLEIGIEGGEEEKFFAGYEQGRQEEQSSLRSEVREMKVACDLVSALWALGQDVGGSSVADFRAFALTRLERAERQLKGLISQKT